MATGVETTSGASTFVTCAIEYPIGIFTRVLFSGGVTGEITAVGHLVSDYVRVAIPEGEKFYVRIWRSNSTRIVFTGSSYPAITGDGFVSSATTTPDLTMGGTVTAATTNVFLPCAIIAFSNCSSIAIMGDSIGFGTGDTINDGLGDLSYSGRAIGPIAAYLNLASPSDDLVKFVVAANRTNRTALAAYASDLLWVIGTNDLSGGRTPAQIATDFATSLALFPTARHWICTLPPRTTSSDSWVTTGNQTVAATEADRITVNSNLRAGGISGQTGCFDVAERLESSWNSGLWSIDTSGPSPARTADGIHPASIGHRYAVRAIDRAVFLRS